MQDYSQHSEQEVILKYFEGRTGNLLDIGANDGQTFSNSLALIQCGWQGDLVEPSHEAFRRLCDLHVWRENVYLHNVAIWDRNAEVDFFESGSLLNGKDYALVSSLKETETERWKTVTKPEHKVISYKTKKVHAITWETFMQHSYCKTFDFITIDVEGCELDILKQMDLVKLGCKMICVEYNGKNQEEFDKIIPIPLHWKNRTNLIYAYPSKPLIV